MHAAGGGVSYTAASFCAWEELEMSSNKTKWRKGHGKAHRFSGGERLDGVFSSVFGAKKKKKKEIKLSFASVK